MVARPSLCRPPLAGWLRISLVVLLLFGQLLPILKPPAAAAPQAGVLQTIGDFLSLGANTLRELQEAIRLAGEEMRSTLQQLSDDIDGLVQELSRTYQDNLNVTIGSLDALTRNKLLELQVLMDQVNQALQDDIRLVTESAKEVIRQAGLEVRRATVELERALKNVIIVGGETAVYVVDRTIYNAILVIALVLLGLGLLLFIWLLFTRKVPSGLAGVLVLAFIAAYLAANGTLVFWPPARGYVMTFTGVGLQQRLEKVASQPRILELVPDTVLIHETREVDVWGSNLRPEGQSPTAKIANNPMPVSAASEQRVVVNVSSLDLPEGSADLVLAYDGREGPREVLRIERPTPIPVPPDLTITAYTVDPPAPIQRRNAHATITVRNQSGDRAGSFVVLWRPYAQHAGLTAMVPGLNAGESRSVGFDFVYPIHGPVDAIAVVDSLNTVAESNEANNSRTLRLNVSQARAQVTVLFTQITVHDDADPSGNGELWLDMDISGQPGRWPSSGTKSVESGRTYPMNLQFVVTLNEGQDLTVYVNGTDEDSPGPPWYDDHDPMGYVRKVYRSADDWGSGPHPERSSCPDGCYTIYYTISVTWLP